LLFLFWFVYLSQDRIRRGHYPSPTKMPVGRKSSKQQKPSQKQRRRTQSRLGQCFQACADDVPHDHRRLAVKRSVKLEKEGRPSFEEICQGVLAVKEAVKRAVKLDDEARCKAMELDEDPKLEDEATSNAAKLEETDDDTFDTETAAKLEEIDESEEWLESQKLTAQFDMSQTGLDWTGLDHDNDTAENFEAELDKLSRNMAKLLRHAVYNEQLLDEDGWLPLSTALRRLHCTLVTVFHAVNRSDRCDGLGARFEIYISGSRVWIRATDGAYYRDRSQKALRRTQK
jgi:hypothetical protein